MAISIKANPLFHHGYTHDEMTCTEPWSKLHLCTIDSQSTMDGHKLNGDHQHCFLLEQYVYMLFLLIKFMFCCCFATAVVASAAAARTVFTGASGAGFPYYKLCCSQLRLLLHPQLVLQLLTQL